MNKPQTGVNNSSLKHTNFSNMLPSNMQKILEVLQNSLQWEPDFCILPMLVTAAAAIGNARTTEIAGYPVHAVLYGCIVGQPSVNKSEPLKFAVNPLRNTFSAQYNDYAALHNDWEQSGRLGQEPILKESVFSDITIEKVAFNLQYNPKGALLAVDELKALFNSFNRQQGSNAEQKYISLFGCEPLVDSRMSRKTVFVPDPHLSLIGSTQPDVLHRTFRGAANNGLKERFLFAYPEAEPRAWNREANKEIRDKAQREWQDIITLLQELKADQRQDGSPSPIHIHMSIDAKNQLFDWQEDNTQRKKRFPNEAAMLGKADVICPRLALILALINNPDTKYIEELDAVRAIRLMEYLIRHSQKVMQTIKEGEPDRASPKQLLFAALPKEFTTGEAIIKGAELEISEPTVKRYLNDTAFFMSVRHGLYNKVQ